MFESAAARPRFRARFPFHLPSLGGGRFAAARDATIVLAAQLKPYGIIVEQVILGDIATLESNKANLGVIQYTQQKAAPAQQQPQQ